MPHVTIYTRSDCPYCESAKKLFASKDVPYEEIDGTGEKRPEMVRRSHGANTFPQIFIGSRHIGGCDDLYELDAKGELDPLLFGKK
ncbi:glutaredoxin 3 [uncultured Bartonella sp.]|uniref:glutaredoxin 3 n=1 Tax=uncultured Bartonella sp. TaxID=104108 RepID=UPI0026151448|nr:glutaredoxin 3 [uncultured Bartonella sp.]